MKLFVILSVPVYKLEAESSMRLGEILIIYKIEIVGLYVRL
jgi:hypothetical protein